MRISATVLAALIATSSAVRLMSAPTAIDKEGRAKSESMPQYGGTATDSSKSGVMTHGEAKINQKDVAGYKELSDAVAKSSDTRQGSLHEHLQGKGLSPDTAKQYSFPGSEAEEGTFKPKGTQAVLDQSADTVRKNNAGPSRVEGQEVAKPEQTPAQAASDAQVVAKEAEKHAAELKENLKTVKTERAKEEAEVKKEDEKLKETLEKANEDKEKAAEVKAEVKAEEKPKEEKPAVVEAKAEAKQAEEKHTEKKKVAEEKQENVQAIKKGDAKTEEKPKEETKPKEEVKPKDEVKPKEEKKEEKTETKKE